jgi:hypothetical protein
MALPFFHLGEQLPGVFLSPHLLIGLFSYTLVRVIDPFRRARICAREAGVGSNGVFPGLNRLIYVAVGMSSPLLHPSSFALVSSTNSGIERADDL